jgi:hypothetical protein
MCAETPSPVDTSGQTASRTDDANSSYDNSVTGEQVADAVEQATGTNPGTAADASHPGPVVVVDNTGEIVDSGSDSTGDTATDSSSDASTPEPVTDSGSTSDSDATAPESDSQTDPASDLEPEIQPAPALDPYPVPVPSNVPQTQLKPIARWSVVPHQRIDAGQVFKAGVIAFSKYGISHVSFTVNGQGYSGPSPIEADRMTINDQTGLIEYWAPIKADDFAGDGLITIEATVYGYDGGIRDKNTDGGGLGLDPLGLVVNPKGSLKTVEAWVSPNGGSGAVNNRNQPFGTIGQAIDAIRKYRSSQGLGNNADGGIVRLLPGRHTSSNGGIDQAIACDNEWLTITTSEGGSAADTIVLPGGVAPTRKIHVRGLTLEGGGTLGMSGTERVQSKMWVDRCVLIGSGRNVPGAHPVGCEYARLFYTDSSITQVQQATSGSALCRGLTITAIGDDAFQNVPCVMNCRVDDIDPQGSGAHADAWQHGMGNDTNKSDDNVIVYNVVATNLKYQSLFIRGDIYSPPSYAQGMAFVNVYMAMREDGYGWGGWGRWVNHLLWWNCTFAVKGMGMMSDTYAGVKYPCKIQNMSVKGCDFAFFGDGAAEFDWNSWENNHFVDGSLTVGQNATTGNDLLDGNGVPQAGSPLVDRMTPVVPVDANNRARTSLSDVGAFEQ